MQGRKEISLWKRTAKSGKVYLSVKVGDPWKPTQKAAPPRYTPRPAPQADPDFDDPIPF